MGLFKKKISIVENDEDIKREIRARVAKQAGLHDEEYVRTGKIGGDNIVGEMSPDVVPASHVSPAAVPIPTAPKEEITHQRDVVSAGSTVEPEVALVGSTVGPEPVPAGPRQIKQPEPTKQTVPTEQPKATKPEKQPKPAKPEKQPKTAKPEKQPKPAKPEKQPKPAKPEKQPKPAKQSKQPKPPKEKRRSKKSKIALILFFVILVLAFIPLYYYISGSANKAPGLTISTMETNISLGTPLVVDGMATDPGDKSGNKVYYTLDQSNPAILYTFDSTAGPFESTINLPQTSDFIGDHTITFYSGDSKGAVSESVIRNFTVINSPLAGIAITKPDKTKYKVGDKFSLKGLVVTAAYENGSKAPVTDYKSSAKDGTTLKKAGKFTINISYTENKITKSAKFAITVTAVVKPPAAPTRQVNNSYPSPSLELYKAGPGAADLQWNAVGGASGYQIQRRTASSGWSTVRTISSAYTSWTDSGPVAGKTYSYRICIYKVVGGEKVYGPFSSSRSIAL